MPDNGSMDLNDFLVHQDPGGPTTVYRFYDQAGSLLYVGITNQQRRRIHQHASTQGWWPLAATATFTHYDTRAAALDAEAAAILVENPAHNTAQPATGRFAPRDPQYQHPLPGRPDLLDALQRQIARAPVTATNVDELLTDLTTGRVTPSDLAGHVAPNLLALIIQSNQ